MKSLFNTSWKSSKQPRKQRKYLANAPNHLKQKQLSANLDKALRAKYNIRSLEVRSDDEVKVMRGKFKGKQGKVLSVIPRYSKIMVEGIEITKKNGEKVAVPLKPSNLKIIKAVDSDKKRFKKATKSTKVEEKPTKPKMEKK